MSGVLMVSLAIPRQSRCQRHDRSITYWVTTSSVLLVSLAIPIHSICQAWQKHYLLSHNFWYTVVAIPIHSGCQRHDRSITCWVTTSAILLVSLAITIHPGCQRHDRSITCWVTTSGILLVSLAIPIHPGCQRHDRSITCWVTTSGIMLWLYLYIQAVTGMTGALPAESQLLVYCWFLFSCCVISKASRRLAADWARISRCIRSKMCLKCEQSKCLHT